MCYREKNGKSMRVCTYVITHKCERALIGDFTGVTTFIVTTNAKKVVLPFSFPVSAIDFANDNVLRQFSENIE